jgi:methylated-DNA-[protein]-cysteine S-methyltransferase
MFADASDSKPGLSVFDSELGWMALVRTPRGVSRLTSAHPSPQEAVAALDMPLLDAVSDTLGEERSTRTLIKRLQSFAAGVFDDFLDVPVDAGRQTSFQRQVAAACRSIPPGQTRSYGDLAAEVGAPRAARAVGSVMASNRVAIIVPCHRVLRSGGKLGGYSLGSGLPLKRRLLELESQMRAGGNSAVFDANRVADSDYAVMGTIG